MVRKKDHCGVSSDQPIRGSYTGPRGNLVFRGNQVNCRKRSRDVIWATKFSKSLKLRERVSEMSGPNISQSWEKDYQRQLLDIRERGGARLCQSMYFHLQFAFPRISLKPFLMSPSSIPSLNATKFLSIIFPIPIPHHITKQTWSRYRSSTTTRGRLLILPCNCWASLLARSSISRSCLYNHFASSWFRPCISSSCVTRSSINTRCSAKPPMICAMMCSCVCSSSFWSWISAAGSLFAVSAVG